MCDRYRFPRLPAAAVAFAVLAGMPAGMPAQDSRVQAVAVIVNEKNPATDLTTDELRAIFNLEKQFWPGGRRVVLLLRPPGSVERQVLLEKVYQTTDEALKKRWVNRLFAGEIPAIPTNVKGAEKTGEAVKHSEGAVSVVAADRIPAGVKVLAIDGKKPGEGGYPLTTARKP